MEAISRSCLPAAAARTKRQRKATCCGVLGAASHRTTCSRSSAAKLTSGLILAMRTHISYWPQYVYLFMIHTTSSEGICSENESLDTEEIAVRIVLRSAAFAPTGPHGRFAGDKGTYQYLAPVYELFQGRLGISC